jgi:hypothetical protein
MSKQNNVNPDHYKIAGRERQGEAIVQDLQKKEFAQHQAEMERWQVQQEGPPPWEVTQSPTVKAEAERTPTRPRRVRASRKAQTTRGGSTRRQDRTVARTRKASRARTSARRSAKSKARKRA